MKFERGPTLATMAVASVTLFALAAACSGRGEEELAARGRLIADARACVSCHTADGSSSVGPTWKGLFGSKVPLDDGSETIANDAYLRESMLEPSAKTVRDFEKGRMETVIKPGSLSDEEIRALIAYIKTLR